MRSSITFGKLLGIPIGISYSWFLTLALVTYVLYDQLSAELPRWGAGPLFGLAGVAGLLFFGSVIAHEMAHSLMAASRGVPVRGITLFLFGGVSHITREARRPWGEFIIAVVGPLLSLALGGAFLGVAYFIAPVFLPGALGDAVLVVTLLLGWTNLALGVFNLLPGFPLDGGRVLRAGLWGLTGNYWLSTRIAVLFGQAFAVIMSLLSVVVFLQTGNPINLWPILVGAFLFVAATGARGAAKDRLRLRSVTAGQAASTSVVPGTMTVEDAVNLHLLRNGRSSALVMTDGDIVGLLTLRGLRRVPKSAWGVALTMQAMTPLSPLPGIDAAQPASEAMEALEEDEGAPAAVVTSGGRVVGVITRSDLYAYLQMRQALDL